jgi:hypothetical protein
LDLQQLLLTPTNIALFPLYAYPAFVAANLRGVDDLGAQNPAFVTRGADTLHCLLAIMLYYCQPNLFARVVLRNQSSITSHSKKFQEFATYLNATAPADTNVTVARIRYQIIVDRDSLIAYEVCCGFSLLLCLAVLPFACFLRLGKKVPKTSSFPFFDTAAQCSPKDMHGYRGWSHLMELRESNTNLLSGPYRIAIRANSEDAEDAEDEHPRNTGAAGLAQANRRVIAGETGAGSARRGVRESCKPK